MKSVIIIGSTPEGWSDLIKSNSDDPQSNVCACAAIIGKVKF